MQHSFLLHQLLGEIKSTIPFLNTVYDVTAILNFCRALHLRGPVYKATILKLHNARNDFEKY